MANRSLKDVMETLAPERRVQVEKRAEELIAEEMTLRELRKARKLSQEVVAKSLAIKQSDVSKIERRLDMYLSTLRRFVEATGGRLEIIARYPNRQAIRINQFEDIGGEDGDDEDLLKA